MTQSCGVNGIVRVRCEGIARMAQHYACSFNCRDGLLGMASHMEIDAREVAVTPENLPEHLFGCDAVVDCLDSITRKKILEEAACAKGIPLVHGAVLGNEGFAFGAERGGMRLASLYPCILPGNEPAERNREPLRQPRLAQPASWPPCS